MRDTVHEIPVGLLYFRSGPYAHAGAQMINGAPLAIEEINSGGFGFRLAPVGVDQGGDPGRYEAARLDIVNRRGIKHIVDRTDRAGSKPASPILRVVK